jgi:hypothetical protein
VVFYVKNSSISLYILNIFNINITEFSLYFVSGFLALITKLFLKGILEIFFDYFEINPGYMISGNNLPDNSSFKVERTLTLNKGSDSGGSENSPLVSGTASSSGTASASSSADKSSSVRTPTHGKGVITESDYEWESDDSKGTIGVGYHSDESGDDGESDVSKFINSIDFEKRVKRASKEEISEALSTIGQAKILYQNSNVPSADEQIALLSKKEDLCIKELYIKLLEEEKSLEEKEKDKGKGKEKE